MSPVLSFVSVPIEPQDIDTLLADMQVGAPYKFEDLYAEYLRIVATEQREPAHAIPLSKALTLRSNMRRGRVTVLKDGKRKQVRVYVRTS